MDEEPIAGIEDALAEIEAFAIEMCRAAGDPAAYSRLRLNHTGSRLTFAVIDADSCGASISGFLKPGRAHVMVRNALNRILRERSRNDAILKAGNYGTTPPWSVDIHPVSFSFLVDAGINPALCALLEPRVTPDTALHRAAEGSSIRIGDARLVAGRVSISTISGRGHPTEDIVSVHEDTQRQQHVMIRQALPHTVVAGLAGRRIGEVTDHPALARAANIRITEAEANGDVLTLGVEDIRMTLAEAPDGTPWLRFPWFTPAD